MTALGIAGAALLVVGWIAWGVYEFWPKKPSDKGL